MIKKNTILEFKKKAENIFEFKYLYRKKKLFAFDSYPYITKQSKCLV